MKTTISIAIVAVLLLTCGAGSTNVFAQKGMGEPSGIARQAVKPEIVTFSGKLVEIKTGPCEKTTGHSPIGTHLLVETDKGDTLNIHLGPEAAVADTVAKLSIGQKMTVQAFCTDKMLEKHYTAQSLTFGKTTVELRDAGLHPVWAGPGAGRGRVAAPPANAKDTMPGTTASLAPGRGRRGGGPPPWSGGGPWRGGRGPDVMFAVDREIFGT